MRGQGDLRLVGDGLGVAVAVQGERRPVADGATVTAADAAGAIALAPA
jgi:hypothetical protein